MRTLITGGAGTLGVNIVGHLGAKSGSVAVIDNFSTGSASALENFDWVSVFEGSVNDQEFLHGVFKDFRPQLVIHLAASYKDPDNYIEDINTNVVGMVNLLDAAREFGVKRILNVQTVLCYGRPAAVPISEEAPLKPISSYAITKVTAEAFLEMGDVPFVSLRLGSVISPGLSIGPIPSFYKKLKEGEIPTVVNSVRDFLDVEDFLNLFDLILEKTEISGIYNVSSGKGTRIGDLLEIITSYLKVEAVPKLIQPAADDVAEIILDPSRIMRATGWRPRVSIEESVYRCLKSFDDAGGTGPIFSHLRSEERTR